MAPEQKRSPARGSADLLGGDQPFHTAKSEKHQQSRPILKLRLGEARHG